MGHWIQVISHPDTCGTHQKGMFIQPTILKTLVAVTAVVGAIVLSSIALIK
jgi:hypothetical protein